MASVPTAADFPPYLTLRGTQDACTRESRNCGSDAYSSARMRSYSRAEEAIKVEGICIAGPDRSPSELPIVHLFKKKEASATQAGMRASHEGTCLFHLGLRLIQLL